MVQGACGREIVEGVEGVGGSRCGDGNEGASMVMVVEAAAETEKELHRGGRLVVGRVTVCALGRCLCRYRLQ